jgi:DNA mismatch repair protein MutS2
LTTALKPEADGAPLRADELSVGMQVAVPHLKAEGQVVSTPKKNAVVVNVGGLKLTVPIDKLRKCKGRESSESSKGRPRRKRGAQPVPIASTPSRTSSNTCDLRGLRVEEGLDQIDAFIDEMLRANEPALFFLHGHGTGAMKEAVREYLGTSPYVTRWEPAPREDGGDAFTVCWL